MLQRDDIIKKQSDLIQKVLSYYIRLSFVSHFLSPMQLNAQITNFQSHRNDKGLSSPKETAYEYIDRDEKLVQVESELKQKSIELLEREIHVESLQNEAKQSKAKISELEERIHQLEKYIRKMKGGLKDRGYNSNVVDGERAKETRELDGREEIDLAAKKSFAPKSKVSIPVAGDSVTTAEGAGGHSSNQLLSNGASQQDTHSGVFSHADKPVKVRPLTRIL